MTLLDCARCKAAFPREVLPQGPASTCPVLSQNSAWLDVHRSVRFGSRPYCSLFGRDSTISRLLLIDGLKPRSSFGTPRGRCIVEAAQGFEFGPLREPYRLKGYRYLFDSDNEG